MSAPLGTRPAVGRDVWYRDPDRPDKHVWLPAKVRRVSPAGLVTLDVEGRGVVAGVRNGIKPGQWCGWADDLWLPREGGELMRGPHGKG